jgi:hypothetical protein
VVVRAVEEADGADATTMAGDGGDAVAGEECVICLFYQVGVGV